MKKPQKNSPAADLGNLVANELHNAVTKSERSPGYRNSAKSSGNIHAKSKKQPPQLQQIISQIDTNTKPVVVQVTPAKIKRPIPSLDELLTGVKPDNLKGKTQQRSIPKAAVRTQAPKLEDALKASSHDVLSRVQPVQNRFSASGNKMNQQVINAVSKISETNRQSHNLYSKPAKTVGFRPNIGVRRYLNREIFMSLLVIVLMAIAARNMLFVSDNTSSNDMIENQGGIVNPERILEQLSDAIAEEKALTGSWPEQIQFFAAFPENAIEWPLEFWQARNIEGKAEIFWEPRDEINFFIIYRDANQAWLKENGQPVRSVPAE